MRTTLLLLIASFATQFITAQDIPTNSIKPDLNITTQGGVLKFTNPVVERVNGSTQNVDQIVLTNYSGVPLKALQFKLIVGKNGGNLILRSVVRGTSIPASAFLFDYEICRGPINTNGSSVDTIKLILLGNGNNVLMPGQTHHVISIVYDVAISQSTSLSTRLALDEVVGATSTPVRDAKIKGGEDEIIYFVNPPVKKDDHITMLQNYPNPFNPNTMISFITNEDGHVLLKIFNSIGQEVATLIDEYKTAGNYDIEFSAIGGSVSGGNASGLTSGVYLYQIKTDSYIQTRKMILMR